MKIQEYQQNRRKKALFKPSSATFLTLSMLFIVLFLCNLASAWDWDNVKDYNEETKTVTITNALGLGDTIATAKLLTPLNVYVMRGKDRKVAEFEINNVESYSNALREMEFFNVKRAMQKFDRDLTYKYKKSLGFETVADYETVCEDKISANGTKYEDCHQEFIGTHQKELFEWIVLDPKAELPQGKITIGIFIDVLPGEKVDWIPTLFGVRVPEWAVWTESLNVNLVSYWKLDETLGTNAEDSHGENNGTTQGMEDADWVSGKIGNALNFDGDPEHVSIPHDSSLSTTTNITIALWVKFDAVNVAQQLVQKADTAGTPNNYYVKLLDTGYLHFGFYNVAWKQLTDTSTQLSTGTWYHIVFTYDQSFIRLYVNSSAKDTAAQNALMIANNDVLEFARSNTGGGTGYLNGIMDEIAIWNRTLTSSEITQLWNDGNGITYIDSFGPTIIFNSPAANANLTSTSVTFNCTVYDLNIVNNVSLYIDGVLNETNSSGINNSDYIFERTLSEGDHNWTCGAWNNDFETIASTRDFSIDITYPSINLTAPPSIIDYHATGNNLTVNWTVTDEHLDSCWLEYNNTNTTVTCGDNTTSFTTNGQENLTFYANDTFGHLSSEFRSWDYRIFENDLSWDSPVTEGNEETFEINLTYDSSQYNIAGSLIYNGTNYAGTRIGSGNTIIFLKEIYAPSVSSDTNLSFYWQLDLIEGLNHSYYNSTTNNQTILNLAVDNCSAYSDLILNYTLRDEESQDLISGENEIIEVDVDIYPVGSTTPIIEFSKEYSSNNAQVCINNNLSNSIYTLGATAKYYTDNHSKEYYNIRNFVLDLSILNNNINLFDLKTDSTTSFQIIYKDESFLPVENALIDITRQYVSEGQFKTIEIPITDNDGRAVASLSAKDTTYTIYVSKDGSLLATFENIVAVCQNELTEECKINLNAFSTVVQPDDFYTHYNIRYSMDYDETLRKITVNFNTVDGGVVLIELETKLFNRFENTTICSDILESSAGTLTCTIPDTYVNSTVLVTLKMNGKIIAQPSISLLPDPADYFGYSAAIIVLIMLMTLPLMFITSLTGMIIGGVIAIFMAGLLFISSGASLLSLSVSLVWLIIAALIIIYKINSGGRGY